MEKLTLLLPENTVHMLHLLARESGHTMGHIVQDMAFERYMTHLMGLTEAKAGLPEPSRRLEG